MCAFTERLVKPLLNLMKRVELTYCHIFPFVQNHVIDYPRFVGFIIYINALKFENDIPHLHAVRLNEDHLLEVFINHDTKIIWFVIIPY